MAEKPKKLTLVIFPASAVIYKVWSVAELEELQFLHGELLRLDWGITRLNWLPGPEVPAEPQRLIDLRGALGDKILAKVQLLDDDQRAPGTITVALADIVLESELSLKYDRYPLALDILKYCQERKQLALALVEEEWEDEGKNTLRFLQALGFLRFNTAPVGTWVLTPKGAMALWWAAKKTKGEGD